MQETHLQNHHFAKNFAIYASDIYWLGINRKKLSFWVVRKAIIENPKTLLKLFTAQCSKFFYFSFLCLESRIYSIHLPINSVKTFMTKICFHTWSGLSMSNKSSNTEYIQTEKSNPIYNLFFRFDKNKVPGINSNE